MRTFLRAHVVFIIVVLVILVSTGIFFMQRDTDPHWITDTVSQGTVQNVISVSGTVDALRTAELAFPVGGTIETLTVRIGDSVKSDQILATLVHNDLKADLQDAEATVLIAEADRDELINGIRDEKRDVSMTTAQIAEEDLVRITREEDEAVTSAYWKLLSSDLEARPQSSDNTDTPPTISGSYFCEEGIYTIAMYNSSAQSGYSYRLGGLESGTYNAYTGSPSALGTCGLKIQFDEEASYGNSEWIIEIPNTQGASYVTNFNAYSIARAKRDNAVAEAEQKLLLAQQNYSLELAEPRTEALTRAHAKVSQAQARKHAVESQIADHILRAPFDGVVTNVDPIVGEAVGTTPVVTLVSDTEFVLTTLIPEIDITKIKIGQKAIVTFDARENEVLDATILFISPLAREIDGVSYFEAKLELNSYVDWLKSGLNADIDIIVDTRENVTRIPKRYLSEQNGDTYVLIPANEKTTKSVPVTVLYTGNDGFVEIQGLNAGDTIIAP